MGVNKTGTLMKAESKLNKPEAEKPKLQRTSTTYPGYDDLWN